MAKKIKILFVSANPDSDRDIYSDHEFKAIQETVEQSKLSDKIDLQIRLAVNTEDLRKAVENYLPHIIHFAGHGSRLGKMQLYGETTSERELIGPKQFAQFLNNYSEAVNCVIFNACYSLDVTESVAKNIKYVVGFPKAVENDIALSFTKGFYESLFKKVNYKSGFRGGLRAIAIKSFDVEEGPVMMGKNLKKVMRCVDAKVKIDKEEKNISQITDRLKEVQSEENELNEKLIDKTKFKDILNWLNGNREEILESLLNYAFIDRRKREKSIIKDELDLIVGLLNTALMLEDESELDEPGIELSFEWDFYDQSLKYLISRVPERVSEESLQTFKVYVNYLKQRLNPVSLI